jgi:DNA-binding transcriptional regulator LsrR (DeoR family)
MRLADRTGATCYPLPTPVITDTPEQRELLQNQRPYRVVCELAARARVAFLGVGTLDARAPLLVDGFITEAEFDQLIEVGAIGEIAGSAFDADGRLVSSALRSRMTAIPVELPLTRLTIGIAGGRSKALAIGAALRGRLLSALITDEVAARAVLSDA